MDEQQARQALSEVKAREDQVREETTRNGAPWWYFLGLGAVFVLLGVSQDLGVSAGVDSIGYWATSLPALAVLVGLGVAVNRSMGVRPRRSSASLCTYSVGLLGAFLVVYIGLGTVLRDHDVRWDQTISSGVALLVLAGLVPLSRKALHRAAARLRAE